MYIEKSNCYTPKPQIPGGLSANYSESESNLDGLWL